MFDDDDFDLDIADLDEIVAEEKPAAKKETKKPAEREASAPKAKSGGIKKILLFGLPVILFIVGGVGTYFFISSSKNAPEAVLVEKPVEAVVKPSIKPLYFGIEPHFNVNLADQSGPGHYLRVSVSIMTRDQAVYDQIELHNPRIRNDLLDLFGSETYAQLRKIEGKRQLRQKALETVISALGGPKVGDKVESVLFTEFVLE